MFLSVTTVTSCLLLSVQFVSDIFALDQCPDSAHLFITAPKKMEALSGSCLLIPCNFSFRSVEQLESWNNVFGVWLKSDHNFIKNPANIIFNSSWKDNLYPMEIIGNLKVNNCTTVFKDLVGNYSNHFYFRLENKPFQATATCNSLSIEVKDSPPKPKIQLPSNLTEKHPATITCSADTPCPQSPPNLTWNLQANSPNKMEKNTYGTFTTNIQETITLSDQHDGYEIICSAKYPVTTNNVEKIKEEIERLTLSVSYAPKQTSVSTSSSGLVSEGMWVNLTCSSRANPPVSSFAWFRKSKDETIKVAEGHFYSFNMTVGGVYFCVATNELGNQKSQEVHLNGKGSNGPSSFYLWGPVLGGIIWVIAAIGVVLFILWMKSQHRSSQKTQEPARVAEKEDLQYAEIDFSMHRSKPSSASAPHSGPEQHTVYSQVRLPRAANRTTHTPESPQTIYNQREDLSPLCRSSLYINCDWVGEGPDFQIPECPSLPTNSWNTNSKAVIKRAQQLMYRITVRFASCTEADRGASEN